MGFPLLVRAIRLSIEAVDRAAGGGRRHARRQPALGVRHRHPAADPARHHRRHDPVPSPRRWASSAPPSPSSPTSPARPRPCPRRSTPSPRCPGGEAGALRLTLVSIAIAMRGAARLRAAGAARRPRIGCAAHDASRSTSATGSAASRSTRAFASARPADRAVRPLGRRQDHAGQRRSPACCGPSAAASCVDGAGAGRHRRAASSCRAHRRRIGYVFQDAPAVPASDRAPEPALRPLVHAARPSAGAELDAVVELLGIGHLLDRRPGRAVGRREAAGRDRPRAARRARGCC